MSVLSMVLLLDPVPVSVPPSCPATVSLVGLLLLGLPNPGILESWNPGIPETFAQCLTDPDPHLLLLIHR